MHARLAAIFLIGCVGPLLGTACGDPGDDDTGSTTAGGQADAAADEDSGITAYDYDEDPPEPQLSVAEVQDAVIDGLPRLLEVDPHLVYSAYSSALDEGDPECPVVYEVDTVEGWSAECTASSGWSYDGRSQGLHLEPGEHDGVAYNEYGYFLSDARLTDPAQQTLEIVGYGELTDETVGELRTVDSWFLGVFRSDAADLADSWLGQDLSVDLRIATSWQPDGRRSLRLDGGASRLPGLVETVSTRDLVIYSQETGTACSKEPAGVVWIKDADGLRYEVAFDGPAEASDEVDAAACDGCGTVTHGDQELGQACLDFDFLLDWTGRPWS